MVVKGYRSIKEIYIESVLRFNIINNMNSVVSTRAA